MGLGNKIRFAWYQMARRNNGGMPTRMEVRWWLHNGPVSTINHEWATMLSCYAKGCDYVELAHLFNSNSIRVKEKVKLAHMRLIGRRLHMSSILKTISKS